MKVLHISTADNFGGAAKAAYRLIQGLRREGVDAKMLVGQKSEMTDENVEVVPRTDTQFKQFYVKTIGRIESVTGLQYLLETWAEQFLQHPFYRAADVVHFHNLHSGFFPLRLVHHMAERKPIVWTCHDVWPMTGHCTYPDLYGCEKFTTGCRQCPHLEDYPKIHIDTTPLLFALKEKEYAPSRIRKMIAPSRWMQDQIKRSRIFSQHSVACVPYGIDTEVFHPLDRASLRTHYKIESDERVLMFSALDLAYERKGGIYLLDAIKRLRNEEGYKGKLVLLAIGHRGTFVMDLPDVRVLSAGLVEDDALMSSFYNLADIYVHPALADNLPNAVLESLACGTPVVAFAAGGLPDMVRPGVTGYLAKPKEASDLARALKRLLEDTEGWAAMSASCRRIAEKEYALHVQTDRMMAIYKEVR